MVLIHGQEIANRATLAFFPPYSEKETTSYIVPTSPFKVGLFGFHKHMLHQLFSLCSAATSIHTGYQPAEG